PAPTAALQPPLPERPKPEIGAWGFDRQGMDATIEPGANFYNYANGGWARATPIPDDKSNYGMFTVLSDRSEERTLEIIEHAEDPRVGDFYKSFRDEAGIEAKALAALQPELDAIAAIKDRAG